MISREVILPRQCVIGFGIPTSKEKFIEDYKHPDKDFAKLFDGLWPKYKQQFIEPYEDVRKSLAKTNMKIIPEFSFEEFRNSFHSHRVIVLFSHWRDDTVEFSDRMVPIDEIIEGIPADFDGLLDLCVCHPTALAAGLRSKRPLCLCRFIDREATPLFWLFFYRVLFKYLERGDLTYLKATEDVIKEFAKK